MTREDIIKLAKECGNWSGQTVEMNDVGLERFFAIATAAEREACAQLCEQRTTYSMPIPCPDGIEGCCVAHFVPGSRAKTSQECAEEIRARGEQ